MGVIEPCCRSRLTAFRSLDRGLLVTVGADVLSATEITESSCRVHAVGKLSVDVDVDPAVDLDAARLKPCLGRRLGCQPGIQDFGGNVACLVHLAAGRATRTRQCHKCFRFQAPSASRRDPHREIDACLSHRPIRLFPYTLKSSAFRNPLPGHGINNGRWRTSVRDECRVLELLVGVAASRRISATIDVT